MVLPRHPGKYLLLVPGNHYFAWSSIAKAKWICKSSITVLMAIKGAGWVWPVVFPGELSFPLGWNSKHEGWCSSQVILTLWKTSLTGSWLQGLGSNGEKVRRWGERKWMSLLSVFVTFGIIPSRVVVFYSKRPHHGSLQPFAVSGGEMHR
jgi:hypothetical protein